MVSCQPENEGAASLATKDAKVDLQDLRGMIQRDVSAGYRSEDDIVTNAVEVFSDEEEPDKLRPHAAAITRELLGAHKQLQQSWPATTDCDRLDKGIVSRQDFSCCGTCGSGEIFEEINHETSQGKKVRGYTFFHTQDTESAVNGEGLYLNYGAVEDGEEPALRIGKEIAAVLGEQGLKVDWNGSWDTRIRVALDWKRRQS
jgi:hypothetical protein